MRYGKLRGPHGDCWISFPVDSAAEAEKFKEGLELGWRLGRSEQMEVIDVRLSKHPAERLWTIEQLESQLKEQS